MALHVNHLKFLVVGRLRLPPVFALGGGAPVSISTAASAAEASRSIETATPDLIVTDIGLDDGFRLETLKGWAALAPVVVVSGAATLAQRVIALEAGIEDFVTLPAADREIGLRIERAVRRWGRKQQEPESLIRFDDFALDPGARVLRRNGRGEVALSASEESLLKLLLTQPDRPASRQEITRRCLKSAFHERSRAPDMLASKLRAKLRELGGGQALETLRGEGYRLRLDQRRA